MTRPVLLAALPVAAVAVIAGVVSYTHVYALAARTQQGSTAAHLLPLSLDGLIVAGSVILLAGSRLGWLGVVPGVVGTLFANVVSMLPHGRLSATVASWPAIAFTVASFVLERWLRSQSEIRNAVADLPAETGKNLPNLNGHGTGTAWAAARPGGWS